MNKKLKTKEMRNVLFKKWVPVEYLKSETGVSQQVKGTGCFEKDFTEDGLFHRWANAYEESSEGFGNYTIALIELPNGQIESVLPQNIRFSDLAPRWF